MGYLLTVISRIWETSLQAVGGHLTLGLGGILFLGFPVALWCGAYGYAIAATAGVAVWLSVLIGIALAALSGAGFAFFYARVSNDSFAVITLASVFAVEALLRSWDAVTGGVLGISGVPRLTPSQTLAQLAVIETVLAATLFVAYALLIRSPLGRSLRAIKENPRALEAMGTSATVVGQIALLFAALFVGVSGILGVSRIQFLDPGFGGIALLIQTITITIIASAPKTMHLIATTAAVVLLPEVLRFFDLPTSILGLARSFLYAIILLVLIHYVTHRTAAHRRV